MYAIVRIQYRLGRGLAAVLLAAALIAGVGAASRAPRHAPAPAAAATSSLLVEVRDPGLDLAHWMAADRLDVLSARVTPVRDRPAGVVGDLRRWRRLEVATDPTSAAALAWRQTTYPQIADARVVR